MNQRSIQVCLLFPCLKLLLFTDTEKQTLKKYETIAITNEIICMETSWIIKTRAITGHDGCSVNVSHCVAVHRHIMSGYFYPRLFVWSDNTCVQLRSEQPITNNFVSQTVVARFSEHFVTVDEL